MDLNQENEEFYQKGEREIIYASADADILHELKTLLSQKEHIKFVNDGAYINEFNTENGEKKLYLRLSFAESENIVWDAEIQCLRDTKNETRIFTIDLGEENEGCMSRVSKYTQLSDSEQLCFLLMEVMDKII